MSPSFPTGGFCVSFFCLLQIFFRRKRRWWKCLYFTIWKAQMLFCSLLTSIDELFLVCLLIFCWCELSINTLQRTYSLTISTRHQFQCFLFSLFPSEIQTLLVPRWLMCTWSALVFRLSHTREGCEHAHPAGGPCHYCGQSQLWRFPGFKNR
jgi:hypothetical protein